MIDETDGQLDRQIYRQTDRQTGSQIDRQIYRQTDRQVVRQIDRQVVRYDNQTVGQSGLQINVSGRWIY